MSRDWEPAGRYDAVGPCPMAMSLDPEDREAVREALAAALAMARP